MDQKASRGEVRQGRRMVSQESRVRESHEFRRNKFVRSPFFFFYVTQIFGLRLRHFRLLRYLLEIFLDPHLRVPCHTRQDMSRRTLGWETSFLGGSKTTTGNRNYLKSTDSYLLVPTGSGVKRKYKKEPPFEQNFRDNVKKSGKGHYNSIIILQGFRTI